MAITRFSLEHQPVIPKELSRLVELASDLVYSWDRNIRSLFHRLDKRRIQYTRRRLIWVVGIDDQYLFHIGAP